MSLPNRRITETSERWTIFSRIVVQPNVIFLNRRAAERYVSETSFTPMSLSRNCMEPNVISPNTMRPKRLYAGTYEYLPR